MLVKPKSLMVSIVSGVVIGLVLLLTLIAYAAYIEIKYRNERSQYCASLQKLIAKNGANDIVSATIR